MLNPSQSAWVKTAIALSVPFILTACGSGKSEAEKAPSQVAVKVNGEDVSVHRLNFVLQQQGIPSTQVNQASPVILERLIDQELMLQKAIEMKVDRDPAVVLALDAARREVLARYYTEKIGSAAEKPADADVEKYFSENPFLFSGRKVFAIQELSIQVDGEKAEALKKMIADKVSVSALVEHLKADNLQFAANQYTRPSEELPLGLLPALSSADAGQPVSVSGGNMLRVLYVVQSQAAPVTLQQARPAIERFILNDRRRRLIENDLQSLRQTAKIDYVGKFAASAPAALSTPTSPASGPAPIAAPAASSNQPLDAQTLKKAWV